MKLPRARCPSCGIVLAVRHDPDSGGTRDLFPAHGKRTCEGSRHVVEADDYTERGHHPTEVEA